MLTSSKRLMLAGAAAALLFVLHPGCSRAGPGDAGGIQKPGSSVVIGNPYPGFCPVQGDKVDVAKAMANPKMYSDYKGKRYLFCCDMCKPDFDKDPAKYIANPAAPKKDA